MENERSETNSKLVNNIPWIVISLLTGIIGWLILEKVEEWDKTTERVNFIEDVLIDNNLAEPDDFR